MLAVEMGGGSGPPGGDAGGLQCQLPAAHWETEPRLVLPQGRAPQAHTHLGAGGGSRFPSAPHTQWGSRSPTARHIPTP